MRWFRRSGDEMIQRVAQADDLADWLRKQADAADDVTRAVCDDAIVALTTAIQRIRLTGQTRGDRSPRTP